MESKKKKVVWPEYGTPYEHLDSKTKEIVLKHLKIAGSFDKWLDIRYFLMEQFHTKKAFFKRKKYSIQDPLASIYYRKYVFMGKEYINSLTPFPCDFKTNMEEILASELDEVGFDTTSVYYQNPLKPAHLRFDEFEKGEWILSDGPKMSHKDKQTLENFKKGVLNLVEDCITMMKNHEKEDNDCKKEYKRLLKKMNI